MDNFKKQFYKGVLELGILKLLYFDNYYGYSLMSTIKDQSNGNLEVKDGTLYPILYRLEDQQLIESYWENPAEGRGKPRKYYRITELGKERYMIMLEDYNQVSSGMKNLLES